MATRLGIEVIDEDLAAIVDDEKAKAGFSWKMGQKTVATPREDTKKHVEQCDHHPETGVDLG